MKAKELASWLADPDQPAARYRYLTEITGERPSSSRARAARAAIPHRGWGAEILARQHPVARATEE